MSGAPPCPVATTRGETEREALGNIRDAIKTYLAMVRKETKGLRTRQILVPT